MIRIWTGQPKNRISSPFEVRKSSLVQKLPTSFEAQPSSYVIQTGESYPAVKQAEKQ